MKRLVQYLFIFSLVFMSCSVHGGEEEGVALEMLDSMQQLMMGSGQFDEVYRIELFDCINRMNPDLLQSHDFAWYGMVEYHRSNGAIGDEWGSSSGHYYEHNATAQNYEGMTIYEPCNYASNTAYYHVTTELCKLDDSALNKWHLSEPEIRALGEVFTHEVMTSGFMHGSHTRLGGSFDTSGIKVFAWIIYQAILVNLDCVDVTEVRDLQFEPRPKSAVELSDELTDMFKNYPVEEWQEQIDSFDIPDYELTFGAIICTLATIGFEEDTADTIITILHDVLHYNDEYFNFLYTEVVPEIKASVQGLELSVVDSALFKIRMVTTVAKFVYAFVWQEEYFLQNHHDLLVSPEFNAWGAQFLPKFNNFLNRFSQFHFKDQNLQDGFNIYPGDVWCNDFDPHGKWHVQSAVGMTELIYLADYVVKITQDLK